MRCKVCYNEFGNGDYCQSCRADKVVGLGNYSGYNVLDVENRHGQNVGTEHSQVIHDSNLTICYNCANAIPGNSEFCPSCGTQLYTKCPNCGNKYSSQYSFCNICGVNAKQFIIDQGNKRRVQAEKDARKRQAEEARQAELERQRLEKERIEKERKEAEERRIEEIKNTPEFIESFDYLSKMHCKAEVGVERTCRATTIISWCTFLPGIVFPTLFISYCAMPLDEYLEHYIGLGWRILIIAFGPFIIAMIFVGIGAYRHNSTKYLDLSNINSPLDILIDTDKYFNQNPINNDLTKSIVAESLDLIRRRKIGTKKSKQLLSSIVLEAYSKISESNK